MLADVKATSASQNQVYLYAPIYISDAANRNREGEAVMLVDVKYRYTILASTMRRLGLTCPEAYILEEQSVYTIL
jgi:hypothetical protein